MSYTLTPIIIDIEAVTSVIGSGDSQLIRQVVGSRTEEMLDIDALGDSFEDFEDEVVAEYVAYQKGDFSYKHEILEPSDSTEEDDDPELAEIKVAFQSGDVAAAKDGLAAMMKSMFEEGLGIELGEDGDDDDESDLPRELSTGGALCDLVLGRPRDPQFGYKYAYALMMLCEHLGKVPNHDHWQSINSSAFAEADETLSEIPFGDESFSTEQLFVDRGAPWTCPAADDFPAIGYLTSDEIHTLDLGKLESLCGTLSTDNEWLAPAISELRDWIGEAKRNSLALVTFYA